MTRVHGDRALWEDPYHGLGILGEGPSLPPLCAAQALALDGRGPHTIWDMLVWPLAVTAATAFHLSQLLFLPSWWNLGLPDVGSGSQAA